MSPCFGPAMWLPCVGCWQAICWQAICWQAICWQAICWQAPAGSAGNLWLLEAEGAGLQLARIAKINHDRAGYCLLHNHGCRTCGPQKEEAAAAVAR